MMFKNRAVQFMEPSEDTNSSWYFYFFFVL
jgi:hypothetical protein